MNSTHIQIIKRLTEAQVEDYEAKSTHSFDSSGREKFEEKMRAAGYVEVPGFVVSDKAYCCSSCEYFTKKKDSPTGWECDKFKFPDRAHGCCDGWEWHPDLRPKEDK